MTFRTYDVTLLIREHGASFYLDKPVAGSYDPSTGSQSKTTTTYQIRGYMYNASAQDIADVELGYKRLLVSADDTDVVLKTGDQVRPVSSAFGDTTYITQVQTIFSGNNVIAYICSLRE